MDFNSSKYLSDFDVVEHTYHLKKQLTITQYSELTFYDRCMFMCYYEHTQLKKGKMDYMYKYGYYKIYKNCNFVINKYFFELPNFKFKIFITYKHFVMVLKFDDELEYFDSAYDPKCTYHKRLIPLLRDSKTANSYTINRIKLQTNNYSCGRWCILRALLHFHKFDSFLEILNENMEKHNLKSYDDTCNFMLAHYYGIKF